MKFAAIAAILAVIFTALPLIAQNPHDGYMFWMPSGELKVGAPADDPSNPTQKSFDYKSTASSETFTIHPRSTRFGVPNGQLVIIRPGAKDTPAFTIDSKPAGKLGVVTFLPVDVTKGKDKVTIEVQSAPKQGSRYLVYYTDDIFKLSKSEFDGQSYQNGLKAFWNGDFGKAKTSFLSAAKSASTPEAARLLRRLARWADANTQLPKIKTGEAAYKLGLYCMVNGFWDTAAASFKKAADMMPSDPDSWYMLGDALSYKWGDIDRNMEPIYPYYKKAAELYPKTETNTFRTFFGFFRKLRVSDGKGGSFVINMTDEQMDYIRKAWEWCSAIMEGASKGKLRMVNTYKVVEDEVAALNDWDPKPFEGLFEPGTVDTFIKMTGWGASDACGMDCGPDRSAFINLGIREWEVLLHEWNHTLDWAMISSELGIGVPETHSSDWCGFQPISSMGMGHHSCNRYYMTPGMYQYVRGSDPVTTPFITDWLATAKPVESAQPLTSEQLSDGKTYEAFFNDLVKKVRAVTTTPSSSEFTVKPKVIDGYVDFTATYPDFPKNGWTFAETYVYSPAKQKVRMWIGSDDNIRIWLNGRLIHKGVYWTCALWTEGKMKDQTAKGVMLEKGWNRLTVQITNRQHPPDWLGGDPKDAFGFSIRICDYKNAEVPGLKYQAEKPAGYKDIPAFVVDPKAPKTYSWKEVGYDYTVLLPELTIDDLRAITGYKTMTATNEMFWDLSKENLDPKIKQYVLDKPDPNNIAFNNELNWYFSPKELTAFVRYKRGGQTRDLLFIRPEGHEAFLSLLPVTNEAKKMGIKSHAEQVIGYFMLDYPGCPNGKGVIVVDTYLGDKLPVDEEDLLDASKLK